MAHKISWHKKKEKTRFKTKLNRHFILWNC